MKVLCCICTALVNQTQNLVATTCGHLFHYECVIEWIGSSKTCPQCRKKVTSKQLFRVFPTMTEDANPEVANLQEVLNEALRRLDSSHNDEELLNESFSQLEVRNLQVQELESQLEVHKIEWQCLQSENAILKRQVESLSGTVDRQSRAHVLELSTQTSQLEADLEAQKNQVLSLNRDLDSQLQIQTDLTIQKSLLEDELKSMSIQMVCLKNEIELLKGNTQTFNYSVGHTTQHHEEWEPSPPVAYEYNQMPVPSAPVLEYITEEFDQPGASGAGAIQKEQTEIGMSRILHETYQGGRGLYPVLPTSPLPRPAPRKIGHSTPHHEQWVSSPPAAYEHQLPVPSALVLKNITEEFVQPGPSGSGAIQKEQPGIETYTTRYEAYHGGRGLYPVLPKRPVPKPAPRKKLTPSSVPLDLPPNTSYKQSHSDVIRKYLSYSKQSETDDYETV